MMDSSRSKFWSPPIYQVDSGFDQLADFLKTNKIGIIGQIGYIENEPDDTVLSTGNSMGPIVVAMKPNDQAILSGLLRRRLSYHPNYGNAHEKMRVHHQSWKVFPSFSIFSEQPTPRRPTGSCHYLVTTGRSWT